MFSEAKFVETIVIKEFIEFCTQFDSKTTADNVLVTSYVNDVMMGSAEARALFNVTKKKYVFYDGCMIQYSLVGFKKVNIHSIMELEVLVEEKMNDIEKLSEEIKFIKAKYDYTILILILWIPLVIYLFWKFGSYLWSLPEIVEYILFLIILLSPSYFAKAAASYFKVKRHKNKELKKIHDQMESISNIKRYYSKKS